MLKQRFSRSQKIMEAGCDEAGRGCLAGPVFAAAVVLPARYRNAELNDSKKLTALQRNRLRVQIEKNAICWKVSAVYPPEIDRINILKASIRGMHQAVDALSVVPALLLIDGNYFITHPNIPHQCIVGGDGLYMSIAGASVLAKTHRDEFMQQLDAEFPGYGWSHNMGYPTREHRKAIMELGLTPWHRRSFNLHQLTIPEIY
ncbi:MAG: ribonuclease HII [Lentimicrobiaceae bacterium]|nr:ribonuclease HII [Lentimicrobiaceae bacterium]